jgi:hypothetical protein
MDDDLKIHPEWEPYTDKFKLFSASEAANTYSLLGEAKKVASGCPFAHLW